MRPGRGGSKPKENAAPTRGIVVGARITDRKFGHRFSPPIPEELMFYLTYWDVVTVVNVNKLPLGAGLGIFQDGNQYMIQGYPDEIKLSEAFPEMSVYEEAGSIQHVSIVYPSPPWDDTEPFLQGLPPRLWAEKQLSAPYDAAHVLNEEGGVHWVVAQSAVSVESDIAVAPSATPAAEALVVQLLHGLPTPRPDCRPEAVIDFRDKRRAELLAFRSVLDSMGERLVKAENSRAEVARIREEIEARILDLHRVLDEKRLSKVASSFKSYMSLGDLEANKVLLPALGAISADATQFSPLLGGAVGLGMNIALTAIARSGRDQLGEDLRPFAYLYHVEAHNRRN
jgi:hypothetical protein